MANTHMLCPNGCPLGFRLRLRKNGDTMAVADDDMNRLKEMLGPCPNLGLLWNRYFPAHNAPKDEALGSSTWGVDFSQEYEEANAIPHPDKRRKAVNRIKENIDRWKGHGALLFFCELAQWALGQPEYTSFVERERGVWAKAVQAEGHRMFKVKSLMRCRPGIGLPCSFENGGISLHPLLGFPILAGRSLKGLLAHYLCEEVFPARKEENDDLQPRAQKLAKHLCPVHDGDDAPEKALARLANRIFGAGPEETESGPSEGAVVFHGGYPAQNLPSQWFDVDVITVHQKPYYDDKSNRQPPSDGENPVPVHFLTLAQGIEFAIGLGLSARGRDMESATQDMLLDFVQDALAAALWDWGFGARAAAGNGLMVRIG
ncbi:MAG TPA: type III-B CRISPR module RAMP protein Cmr6 [Candidatus Hydrogenedentes bacterium]|nr:type III-B CRISPR module RAMP protein Cmr6 [Candidatus Hydrogenedentota bacterium]HPG70126.1 type III-B CRISPR module RAMP protein Cmr6 [Candidatus Hydrogenedentota bacterium]